MKKEYNNTVAQLNAISWNMRQMAEQLERLNNNIERIYNLNPPDHADPLEKFREKSKPNSALKNFLKNLNDE
jgi:hypothetical protein